MSGKETVMLFLIQPYCSLSVPEMKQLKKFLKISLEPDQTQTVNFTLSTDDWSVYYPQICHGLKKVAEDYAYVVGIKPETDCDEPAFTLKEEAMQIKQREEHQVLRGYCAVFNAKKEEVRRLREELDEEGGGRRGQVKEKEGEENN